jgi:hypothetical protein
MADRWEPLPIEAPVFQNLDESVLRRASRTLENGFVNEAKGHTRFPGLTLWKQLPSRGPVYLSDWRTDLVAVTGLGRIYRLGRGRQEVDVTAAVPTGGRRAVFAKSEDEMAIAMGGDIIGLGNDRTYVLSPDAPKSSHVAYLSGFFLAIEIGSQRFFYTDAGAYRTWNPLNVFSAESRPDDLTALVVTEFGEALLAGPESIEQFEPYPGGDFPFFRRWSVGEGLIAPYTLVAGDDGVWGLNRLVEFNRYSGQSSTPLSGNVGMVLEKADSYDDAFSLGPMHLFGQKFIILTLPRATNPYGTKGMTFLFDYQNKRWSFLHGWDERLQLPSAFPAVSHHFLWGKHFFGGPSGEIWEIDDTNFMYGSQPQRMFWRSAAIDIFGRARIDDLRTRLLRGDLRARDQDAVIQLRVRRDNREWGKWQTKALGRRGDRLPYIYWGAQGEGHTHQFEYRVLSNAPVEVVALEARITRVD